MGNLFHKKKDDFQISKNNNITFAWQTEDIRKEKMREEMEDPLMARINLKRMGQDYQIFAPKEKTNFYKCFSEGQQGFYYATQKHRAKKTMFVIKRWDPFLPQSLNLKNEACFIVDEKKSKAPPRLYFLPFIVRSRPMKCEIDQFIDFCKEKNIISSEFDHESVNKLKNETYSPDIVLMDPSQKKYVYTWYEMKKKYGAKTQTGDRLTDTLSTLAMFYPENITEFLTMSSYIGSKLVKRDTITDTNIGAPIQMVKKITKQAKIGSNGNEKEFDIKDDGLEW